MKAGCRGFVFGPIAATLALLLGMLPVPARGEMVAPHVVQPDVVTPHVTDPAADVPAENASTDEASGIGKVAGVEQATQPNAGSPVGDKPIAGRPGSIPGVRCKHKPGYVCPYFCPSGAHSCEADPVPVPNLADFVLTIFYTNPEFSPLMYLQTPHLCAGAREVSFIHRFFVDLADTYGIDHDTVLELEIKQGFASLYFEALSMTARPDCQTNVVN
jgi:hypothetical protein